MPLSNLRSSIIQNVFSLPESFRIDKFIRSVIVLTFIIEGIGAFLLYFIFKNAHVPDPLWSAVFHSVSSFCTAGFGLYNDSFMSLTDNFWLNIVIAILSYLAAIGFIVCVDFWRKIRGKVQSITLTSKIILILLMFCGRLGPLTFSIALFFKPIPKTELQDTDLAI